MNDPIVTVASQYGNSPTILSIIESMNAAIDPTVDINNFLINVWQISTAQGFGLDIWGRIVGISRIVPTTPATVLTDDQFRSLILLKALANISTATSYSIKTLLQNWMQGRGVCFVSDLGQMEILYTFEFPLQPFEIDIVTQSGIFFHPAGVGGWMINSQFPVFGFKGMTDGAVPFNQAPFMTNGNPYAVS